MSIEVNVARDYTAYPLGRFRSAWPYSGERFREEFLESPLRRGEPVVVDLNGVRGLAPSFLEEAFGGLVTAGISIAQLEQLLTIVCSDQARIQEIWLYIRAAEGADAH